MALLDDGTKPRRSLRNTSRARPHARDSIRRSSLPLGDRARRALWSVACLAFFRFSPRPLHGWRRLILRLFGARIGDGALVYPSARIWAPWNLQMGPLSCLGPDVDCYTVAPIRIGAYASVSQYSYLCSAGHDIDSADLFLTSAPIEIGDFAWVAADAFIGPGVCIGEGAVVGARTSVFRDVAPWSVVVGNPARAIRMRSQAVAAKRAQNAGTSHGAPR